MNDNLKLLVLGWLYLEDEMIKSQLDNIHAMGFQDLIYGDNKKYAWFARIPEVRERILAIEISDEQLASVDYLSGECCDTHSMIMPNWDGTGDEFDLESFEGIEKLTNLKSLELLQLEKVIDGHKLLEMQLTEINSCEGLSDAIVIELERRGVVFS